MTWPSTTGEGIGLSNYSRMNVTSPPEVASDPIYPFRYNRSKHSTSNVMCPLNSSGIFGMSEILRNPTTVCLSV